MDIGAIYNTDGITRGGIWEKIGKGPVREDSADADLYKLLIRDLSTGGIIRQHTERDYNGTVIPKTPQRRPKGSGPKPPVSAFDEEQGYELTELGKQFVHYAMSDLPLRIEFGDPAPSQADIQMTHNIRDAAKGVNIALHDHIIVAKSGTVSFMDQGLL